MCTLPILTKTFRCAEPLRSIATESQCFHRNRDEIREKSRNYRKENNAILIAKERLYRFQNKAMLEDRRRQYRFRNSVILLEKRRLYRSQNKAMLSESDRQYYLRNKAKLVERARQYRNRGENIQKDRDYRFRNKAKIEEQRRYYYRQNKARITEKMLLFYLRRHKNPSAYSPRIIPYKSWKTPEIVRAFFESVATRLHVSTPSDWYRVSRAQMAALGGI